MKNLSDREKVGEQLGIVGYELWKSHLVGNNCPSNQKRYDRMKEPRAEDLVLELSSLQLHILYE